MSFSSEQLTNIGYYLAGIGTGTFLGMGIRVNYDNIKNFNPKKIIYRKHYNKKNTLYLNDLIHDGTVKYIKKIMLYIKDDDEIDIFIDTNGGSFACAQMISNIITSHKGITNAYVLNKAFSGGTLIALSCTNLYMHKNAHMSPVDVIHSDFFDAIQYSSIKNVIDNKSKDRINDNTFLLADQATKCGNILMTIFNIIIGNRYKKEIADKIYDEIFRGEKYIHSTAFSVQHLLNIGVNVKYMSLKDVNRVSCTI